MMMRFLISAAVVAVVGFPLSAQTPSDADGPLIWAKTAGPTTPIRIYHEANVGGSVRIVGWDRDSVVFRGRAPAGMSFHGGDAENMKLGIDFGGDKKVTKLV